jgi:hypothetical protein
MTSFISSFKPLLIALCIILAVEAASHLVPVPQRYNSDLLTLAPQQKERVTNIFLIEKMNTLANMPARFLQFGDSSGFYGLKPEIVTQRVKGEWLNFGCCARMGFGGYRTYAAEVLKHQRAAGGNPTFMVINITPYYAATREFEESELPEALHLAYGQPWRYESWLAGWRLSFTNWLYLGKPVDEFLDQRTDKYWSGDFSNMRPELDRLNQTHGWMERPGPAKPITMDECVFPVDEERLEWYARRQPQLLLRRELNETANFAKTQGLTLVLLFNPVPCEAERSDSAATLQREIEAFKAEWPDVIVPVDFIRRYPPELFKDIWHLNVVGAERNSREIAEALVKAGVR